jgi:hypothetical protein
MRPNNRQLKDDDAAADRLQSVCESVGREWRTDWVWGECDLVKGTGKLVRADPDPLPGQAFIDHRTEKKYLSCEPYKVETGGDQKRTCTNAVC